MQQTTNLESLRQQAAVPREAALPNIVPGFGSSQSFELMVRQSKLLMATTLVPATYRAVTEKKVRGGGVEYVENPNALANCCVALNMAQRMGADPLMVMQNLYIVEGRPSWSAQWIIAAINGCGRFSPLRFDLKDTGEKEVEYSTTEWVKGPNGNEKQNRTHKVKVRNLECVAWAIEKDTGERITSPTVSIEMAVREGWYGKNGSKWQTMPEVMLRYRTASFFGKLYAPELLMGLQTVEESQDAIEATPQADGSFAVDVDSLRRAAASAGDTGETINATVEETAAEPANGEQMPGSIDMTTGEIMEPVAEAAPQNEPDADFVATMDKAEQPKAEPRQRRQRETLDLE